MRVALFCHSLVSDWNHGNAHFLRGVASELQARGHQIDVYEPRDAWSVQNLQADAGPAALATYRRAYPRLTSHRYDPAAFDVEAAVDGADLVLAHQRNSPDLAPKSGRARAGLRFTLLFHDTHHRSVSEPDAMAA